MTALITGAGAGIGRATALAFAAAGLRTACADLDAEAAARTAAAAGERATAHQVDVADRASTEALLAATGPVSALVHCAGVQGTGTALSTDPARWDHTIAVNLTGTWLMIRAVLPGMLEHGGGAIVTVASAAGLSGIPDTAAYSAAKGGVIALTRQVAVDFGARGVRANSICPGTVPTDTIRDLFGAGSPDWEERAARPYPLRRLGTADEVAALALHLASDAAAWTTGAAIPIDGGLTAAAWTPR